MVSEIRIYVEGGGHTKSGDTALREGMSAFLQEVILKARAKKIRWNIIRCGSRNEAFDDFKTALQTHPTAFNILLVDSEAPVAAKNTVWQHLKTRDNWTKPNSCTDEQCHLMVQMMESWLIADGEKLQEHYQGNFVTQVIPNMRDVEAIAKDDVMRMLERATNNRYTKLEGLKLLGKVRAAEVRKKAKHCERFLTMLEDKVK